MSNRPQQRRRAEKTRRGKEKRRESSKAWLERRNEWDRSDLKAAQRRELREHQHNRCWWCLRELGYGETTIDHIIPLCRDGAIDEIENMVASCEKCNKLRGKLFSGDFAEICGVVPPKVCPPAERLGPGKVRSE